MTRDYVDSVLMSPGVLQVLVDQANAFVIKKYEETNPRSWACPSKDSPALKLECIVRAWAGVPYPFPEEFPLGLVWAAGHGKYPSTVHPTNQDYDELAKTIFDEKAGLNDSNYITLKFVRNLLGPDATIFELPLINP